MRTRRAASQQVTREALLAAATRLFTDEGYRGVTVDEIATAAGVTRGAVYSCFTSKFHLLLETLAQAVETRPGDPCASGDGVVTFARAYLGGGPVLTGEVLAEVSGEAGLGAVLADAVRAADALMAVALWRAGSEAALECPRWRDVAREVMVVLRAAALTAATAPQIVDRDAVVRLCAILADTALPGRRTRSATSPRRGGPRSNSRAGTTGWTLPPCPDLVTGEACLNAEGVIVVVGPRELSEAITELGSATSGDARVVVVLAEAETAALIRVALLDVTRALRAAGLARGLPLRVVVDSTGAVAAAAGIRDEQ
ncbi:TetR/AcrR family transcriptional regulator [Nocardia sp. NPDC003482]